MRSNLRDYLDAFQVMWRWLATPKWRDWRWLVFGLPLFPGVSFMWPDWKLK